jgi:hypothetical protein
MPFWQHDDETVRTRPQARSQLRCGKLRDDAPAARAGMRGTGSNYA